MRGKIHSIRFSEYCQILREGINDFIHFEKVFSENSIELPHSNSKYIYMYVLVKYITDEGYINVAVLLMF